jgi:hypothetical protein
MAAVPRTDFIAPPTSVTAARSGPPTRVASVGQNVDQLYAGAGVAFDAAAFGYAEEGRASFDRGDGRSRQHTPGLINAPSQTFAAILEASDQFFRGGGDDANIRARKFTGLVSKAIEIYENNAKVINGTNVIRGTSFSAVL